MLPVEIIIFAALVLLLILAIYWELEDYKRVYAIEPSNRFLACFGYESRVYWRAIYIPSFIVALILTFIFNKMYGPCAHDCRCYNFCGFNFNFWVFFVLLSFLFVVFYAVSLLIVYNIYNVLCKIGDRIY